MRRRTLKGIAKQLGANAFKHYAHDYINEKVRVDKSVDDAIRCLEEYRYDENLIRHFESLKCFPEVIWEYTSKYPKK